MLSVQDETPQPTDNSEAILKDIEFPEELENDPSKMQVPTVETRDRKPSEDIAILEEKLVETKNEIANKLNIYLEDKKELEFRMRNLDAQKKAVKHKEELLKSQVMEDTQNGDISEAGDNNTLKAIEKSLQAEKDVLNQKESLLSSILKFNENNQFVSYLTLEIIH